MTGAASDATSTLELHRDGRARVWLWVAAASSLAALLSAGQIYGRHATSGTTLQWSRLLWTNFLAWLPWIPIGRFALWAAARWPVRGRHAWSRLGGHALLAVVAATCFLVYLGLFHALVVDPGGGPHTAERLWRSVLAALGESFLIAMLLYGFATAIGMSRGPYEMGGRQRAIPSQADAGRKSRAQPTLAVPVRGRIRYFPVAKIDWLEAAGCYVRVHSGSSAHLLRRPLTALCTELGDHGLARVHRSAAVNVDRIAELERRPYGEAVVRLDGGAEVKVSRSYRARLLERLG